MSSKNIYKHTLNLPETNFPMKANLPVSEPKRLKKWEEEKIYEKMLEIRSNAPIFTLHDGPPYANGPIHTGHAVNKILKDMILKFKHVCGFQAPLTPGWDCHGLPIELNIEKKYGKADKIGAEAFRKYCREYAASQIELQKEDFIRLGIMAHWSKHYDTKNFKSEADILRSLGKIIESGHVYQGFKPVYWCLDCASALAEAEVEYNQKQSNAIDVAFQIDIHQTLSPELSVLVQHNAKFIIWTTTPWTLPANQAIAVSKELQYQLLSVQMGLEEASYILVAVDLKPQVLSRYQIDQFEILESFSGKQLCGIKLLHPFGDRQVSVVHGDHVTTETGTGLVHIAPTCGVEDFQIGVREQLSMDIYVDDRGCYTEKAGYLAGIHIKKAEMIIIDHLKKQSNLIHQESYEHSYPYCWRHKTPVIFRLTHQWFIQMSEKGLLQEARQAANQVNWLPDWGADRLKSMLDKRPDWCISRQRYWGVPIAIFVHRKTSKLHPDTLSIIEAVALAIEAEGVDAWFNDPFRFLPESDHQDYQAIKDVLDVWFDSGVTHQFVVQDILKQRISDLYLEGKDQYRGWFQSSLLTAVAMGKRTPYQQVVTHGFVVDHLGRKMSKSIGNVISPQDVAKKLGADVLRLWVAMNDYTGELTISDEILSHVVDHYRRIRNTFRFLLGNLNHFDPKIDVVPFEKMVKLDQWVLSEARELQQIVYKHYKDYQFHLGLQKIILFCTETLGGFYLDLVKDRLYTTPQKSLARRSVQTVLFHLFESMLTQLMPVLSFTMDEATNYAHWHKEGAFFIDEYKVLGDFECDLDFSKDIEQIQVVKKSLEKCLDELRKKGVIGNSLMAKVHLFASEKWRVVFNRFGHELRFLLMVSEVMIHPIEHLKNDAEQVDEALFFHVEKSTFFQCARCWHYHDSVDKNSKHRHLCERCITNISTNDGETRLFV